MLHGITQALLQMVLLQGLQERAQALSLQQPGKIVDCHLDAVICESVSCPCMSVCLSVCVYVCLCVSVCLCVHLCVCLTCALFNYQCTVCLSITCDPVLREVVGADAVGARSGHVADLPHQQILDGTQRDSQVCTWCGGRLQCGHGRKGGCARM